MPTIAGGKGRPVASVRRVGLTGFMLAAGLFLITAATPAFAAGGGVFVTGHDPDFHALQGFNATGAQNMLKDAVKYVTHDKASPSVLLVTDLHNPGAGYSDPRDGLSASGFRFTVADDGTCLAPGTAGCTGNSRADVHSVAFTNYDVVMVASDFGGWLRQGELDALNGRKSDIFTYVDGGGGLVVLSESGPLSVACCGLTLANQYGFLPFLVSGQNLSQTETGYTVTPLGATLGLTTSDVNGNFSHSVFTPNPTCGLCGFSIVDQDTSGRILSLAERDEQIGAGGGTDGTVGGLTATPELDSLGLFGSGIVSLASYALLRRRARRSAGD